MTTKLILHYIIDGAFFIGLLYGIHLARGILTRLECIHYVLARREQKEKEGIYVSRR